MINNLITIIVPIYNVESYIEKCIASICKQTYKYLEILLLDDGSTDSSGMICDNYASLDSRIRVIHKKNGGLSDTRNVGLELAQGEYIGFVDGDDSIDSEMYKTLVYNIEKYNADISSCGYDMIYTNKTITVSEGTGIHCYTTEEAFKVLLHKNSMGIIACNKLYRRSVFESIQFPSRRYFEDINTIYKVLAKASLVVYDTRVFYHYVQRGDSINGVNFKKKNLSSSIYDMEAAADELLLFTSRKYPSAIVDITIGCIEYYVRIINQEIYNGINNSKLQMKARKIIHNYYIEILKAPYLSLKKKLQLSIFLYSFPIYSILIKLYLGLFRK